MRRLLVPIISLAVIAFVVFEVFNSAASQTNAIFHTTPSGLVPPSAVSRSDLSRLTDEKAASGGTTAPIVNGATGADTTPGLAYGGGDTPPVEQFLEAAAPTTAAASAPTPATDGYGALHYG